MKIFGAIVIIFMFIIFVVDCVRLNRSKTIEEKQAIFMDSVMYMLFVTTMSIVSISFK